MNSAQVLANTADSLIATLGGVMRILYLRPLAKYIPSSSTPKSSPNVQEIVRNNGDFKATCFAINAKVESDFKKAQEYVDAAFDKVWPIYEYSRRWDFDAYKRQAHTVASLKKEMEKVASWEKELEKMRTRQTCGMLEVESRKLRQTLIPMTTEKMDVSASTARRSPHHGKPSTHPTQMPCRSPGEMRPPRAMVQPPGSCTMAPRAMAAAPGAADEAGWAANGHGADEEPACCWASTGAGVSKMVPCTTAGCARPRSLALAVENSSSVRKPCCFRSASFLNSSASKMVPSLSVPPPSSGATLWGSMASRGSRQCTAAVERCAGLPP